MTEHLADWGVGIGVAVLVIKQLFDMIRKSSERTHDMLQQNTLFSRDDYLRLEGHIADMRAELQIVLIANTKLNEALQSGARRDVEFYDRQLPALINRGRDRDYRIETNRDAINELRHRAGLAPIAQTPPFGTPAIPPPIPQHVDDAGSGSPHDIVKGPKK